MVFCMKQPSRRLFCEILQRIMNHSVEFRRWLLQCLVTPLIKIISTLGLSFFLFAHCEAESVSIEAFGKITDRFEREQIMERAPSEQKEELQKIDIHLRVLARHGGEAGLKEAKENLIIEKRGLRWLQDAFDVQISAWDTYMYEVMTASEKAGMTRQQLVQTERGLREGQDALRKRMSVIHSLVFNIAPSPQALLLEKQVEAFGLNLHIQRTSPPGNVVPLTKEEIAKIDQRMDQFLDAMKILPKQVLSKTRRTTMLSLNCRSFSTMD